MTRTPEHVTFRLNEILSARPELGPALMDIVLELLGAERKHPAWPTDAVHASAVLNEEAGELTQAALDFHYGAPASLNLPDNGNRRMREEATQCGAMALRFLAGIDGYSPCAWREPHE